MRRASPIAKRGEWTVGLYACSAYYLLDVVYTGLVHREASWRSLVLGLAMLVIALAVCQRKAQ